MSDNEAETDSSSTTKSDIGNWGLSLAMGIALGTAFGVAIDEIAMGVSLGVVGGVVYQLFFRSGKKKSTD